NRSATERLPDRPVVGAVDVVGIADDGAAHAGPPPPPVPERRATVRRHPARLQVGDDVLSRAEARAGTVYPAVAHDALLLSGPNGESCRSTSCLIRSSTNSRSSTVR